MGECKHGACGDCNPLGYQMEKLDAWKTAYSTLKGSEADWDTEPVTPRDVLLLALFLTGVEFDAG